MNELLQEIKRNGNGNGHESPFTLAPKKSPEEIAREKMRRAMPEIRRAVNELRIIAQAKWLFGTISDDSFMFEFGGDGFGTLVTTIKDLACRYKHNRDSVSKWLQTLVAEQVIWCEVEGNALIIHISALVPPPSHKASALQRMKARAMAARRERAEDTGTPVFLPSKGQSARETEEISTSCRDVPARDAEDTGTGCRQLPQGLPTTSARNGGYLPQPLPTPPPSHAETCPQGLPTTSASPAEVSSTMQVQSSMATPRKSRLETTPGEYGEKENSLSVHKGFNALKRKGGEKSFLAEVAETMEQWSPAKEKKEMANYGGWWRNRYREDSNKAWRVIGELRSMVNEHRITKDPGRCAMDLWKRFA
jgi:hypothetical protein